LNKHEKIKKADVKTILNIGSTVTKKLLELNVIEIIKEEVKENINTLP